MCPLFCFRVKNMDLASQIQSITKELVEAEGLELVHVEYNSKGAAPLLRVYIDKTGGVTLGDCQRISKHLGVLLDVEDFIPQRYVLEVSSPGIERPLFNPSDYERFSGKEVRVALSEKIDNRKNFTGQIRGVAEGYVVLECQGETYRIPLDKIKRANLTYSFE